VDEKDDPKTDHKESGEPKMDQGKTGDAPKKSQAGGPGGAQKVGPDGMFRNFAGRTPPATAPRSWRFQRMKVTWYESLS